MLIGEGILRILGLPHINLLKMNTIVESERGKFTTYDPTLGWKGKENAVDVFRWIDCTCHVKQNRYGFRGREIPHERSEKKRLLVLGDSYTWGFGVDENKIFTALLDQKGEWEVLNLGVSGYGTDQELLLWQIQGKKWKPDVVLLMVNLWTDLWDNISSQRYGYEKPFFILDRTGKLVLSNVPVPRKKAPQSKFHVNESEVTPFWVRLLGYSHLAATLVNTGTKFSSIRNFLEKKNIIPARQGGFEWEARMYTSPRDEEMKNSWSVTTALILRLAREVNAEGGKLIVAVAPGPAQVYPEIWIQTLGKRPNLDPTYPDRFLYSWCRDNGISFIDLLNPLREAANSNPHLYFPVNLHWTAAGHAVVAEVLAREIPKIIK
ncbi:MAG: GDSL-type esterase/lipase family protein [Syntrophales bacterium]|nr:GDSL-type esterase/lipase family protein [Syntrophales bacterium]